MVMQTEVTPARPAHARSGHQLSKTRRGLADAQNHFAALFRASHQYPGHVERGELEVAARLCRTLRRDRQLLEAFISMKLDQDTATHAELERGDLVVVEERVCEVEQKLHGTDLGPNFADACVICVRVLGSSRVIYERIGHGERVARWKESL